MPGRASITVAFALLVGVFTCVAYAEQASAAANVRTASAIRPCSIKSMPRLRSPLRPTDGC
jgi:hypothetical protein